MRVANRSGDYCPPVTEDLQLNVYKGITGKILDGRQGVRRNLQHKSRFATKVAATVPRTKIYQ